jgi:hypothetical protein
MRGPALAAIALCAACGAEVGGNIATTDVGPDDDAALADQDGPGPDAPLGAFSAPQKVAIAGTGAGEDDASLSNSGLEMVFAVANAADSNRKDLFYTSRPDLLSVFGAPTKLPFSVDGSAEETPRFSDDDLTLFFAKTNGTNQLDIFRVTRPTAGTPGFGTPTLVEGVNGTLVDKWFMPCDGNRYLMIIGADIAEGVLGGGLPTVVGDLSTPQSETGPFVTKDCLTTYFASTRPDGALNRIHTSSRTAIGQPWSVPTVVDTFAALGGAQQDPFISNDQRTFVFVSNVDGSNDVYISTR